MNYCVLSGLIASIPTLRYYGKKVPLTKFTLTLGVTKSPEGGITVVCRDEMAIAAAKYIQSGDRVTVEGTIDQDEILCDDGRWVNKMYLRAYEIRKCHFVLGLLGVRENYPLGLPSEQAE